MRERRLQWQWRQALSLSLSEQEDLLPLRRTPALDQLLSADNCAFLELSSGCVLFGRSEVSLQLADSTSTIDTITTSTTSSSPLAAPIKTASFSSTLDMLIASSLDDNNWHTTAGSSIASNEVFWP